MVNDILVAVVPKILSRSGHISVIIMYMVSDMYANIRSCINIPLSSMTNITHCTDINWMHHLKLAYVSLYVYLVGRYTAPDHLMKAYVSRNMYV